MKSAKAVGGSHRPWLLLFLITLVIAAVFYIRHQKTPKPELPKPPERSRNDLTLQDGRLLDGTVPFSGIVFETYGGGEVKSRSVVSNGLLQGLSEGWETNGVLQVSEYFAANISHGTRTKYYSNGNRLSVANVVNGQLEGLYERWHENGTLAEQIHLTNGVADGESLAFHPDGSLKARVRLDHGKVVEQKFWEPGEMRGSGSN